MKKKIVITSTAVLLTLILIISSFTGCLEKNKEQDENIQKTASIQQLINNASPKDTIHIPMDTYYESIIIDKPLTLIGEDKDKTIIDGKNAENVVYITADNARLENITIRNSGGYKDNAGIKIVSDNNLIKNCVIYRTKTGVYFDKSKNSIVSNCLFHTNGEGVYFSNSVENIIENCEIQHNSFGLHLFDSQGTKIINSYIHTNGLGVYAKNSTTVEIEQCAICDNNQDGGGIWLFGCDNFLVSKCNINHNGVGVELFKTNDVKIKNCNFYDNMYKAILFEHSEGTLITYCDIRDSFRTALSVQYSQCTISENNIVGNKLSGIEFLGNTKCNARNNWWGSRFGPSITSFKEGDKVTFAPLKIKINNWKKEELYNIGAGWLTEDFFSKSDYSFERFEDIKFEGIDSDNDKATDEWEKKWNYDPCKWDDHENLDPDNDALNNVEECYTDQWGSSPFYKDIFIEVDWLKSNSKETNKPPKEFIQEAINVLKEHEISLHVDIGDLGKGGEIPQEKVMTAAEYRDLYWDYFLENNLNNPRKGIFHYATITNKVEELWNGFVFFGWDNIDTIGVCIETTYSNHKYMEKGKLIVAGIIHELGHTMGLLIDDHGGIDNTASGKYLNLQRHLYKNYKSIMNYRYVYSIMGYSNGSNGKGDFDDWSNLDFSFFKNTNFELIK